MFQFVRRHWIPYLIAAVIAVLLGFGAALFVGVKGSTSAEEREARIESEASRSDTFDTIANLGYGDGSGEEEAAAEGESDGASTEGEGADSDQSAEAATEGEQAEGEEAAAE